MGFFLDCVKCSLSEKVIKLLIIIIFQYAFEYNSLNAKSATFNKIELFNKIYKAKDDKTVYSVLKALNKVVS